MPPTPSTSTPSSSPIASAPRGPQPRRRRRRPPRPRPSRPRRRTTVARALALLLAVSMTSPLWAAPGDITQVPAPALGADPPKARDLPDGDMSVSTETGALQYSYPIAVPPGRLGMQPSLALTYSSQGATYGGIAAGWSLSIPEITIDTSDSLIARKLQAGGNAPPRFASTLAGGRPLVPVSEPHLADVAQTYRAKNDDTWARYERLVPGAGARWRVRTPDGITHHFGEPALAPAATEAWSPLTRTVDSFGNTIEYAWEGSRIAQVRYTSNPQAGLPAFARVDFVWDLGPTCDGLAVGQQEDRRLGLVRGELQLQRVRAIAFDPANGTTQHTRELTLSYGADAAACGLTRAPVRLLTEIQESAWGATAPRVDLPPVRFDYNRLGRGFDHVATQGLPWSDPSGRERNLGWGIRAVGSSWPTQEAMMLDFDGDGLPDRLTSYIDPQAPDECKFVWSKNLGRSGGSIVFGAESAPMRLPRLPWATAAKGTTETCSLSAQLTMHANRPDPPQQNEACPVTMGTYLAYRWLDMNGDQLPDLVAAIHHDAKHFVPDTIDLSSMGWAAPWPSCSDEPSCPALSSVCIDELIDCSSVDGQCVADEGGVNACVDAAPRVPCGVLAKQTGGSTPCLDLCQGDRCAEICANQDRIDPPGSPPQCGYKNAHRKCDRYPWFIYENRGGSLAATPQIKYQPIPLESDGGDSSFGGTSLGSTRHALQDIDGDGHLDAVIRGRYIETALDIKFRNHVWLVFPGDGSGGFVRDANRMPHVWLVPDAAPVSLSCSSPVGEICSELQALRDPPLHENPYDVRGLSTVMDLNGDGAPDLLWKRSVFQSSHPSAPFVVWEAVADSDPIVLYKGNGRRFEYGGSPGDPLGQALSSQGVDHFSRSHIAPDAHLSNHFMTHGVRHSRARFLDVDSDGRPDLLESGLNGTGWEQPTLFINIGGHLATAVTPPELGAWLHQRTDARPTGMSDPREWGWEMTRDVIDLDGDGMPEAWDFVAGPISRREDSDRQPLRLLSGIHNGRGAYASITYAPSTDASVVTQDAGTTVNGERKAMPRVQWVVSSTSLTDAWDPDVSTTTYRYQHPIWKADDEGKWDFRGFAEVTTTRPSGARQVDTYGYDVDWSGRLKMSRVYEAGDAGLQYPKTITETAWTAFLLFGNALRTFHPTLEKHYTCGNGQTEAQCRATAARLKQSLKVWVPIATNRPEGGPALMYFQQQERTYEGLAYDAGDRRWHKSRYLYADQDDYRLQQTGHTELQSTGGPVSQDLWTNQEVWVYDALNRVATAHHQYFAAGDEDTKAITTTEYDLTTGVKLWTRAPRNHGTTLVESYAYDATRRFVTETTNELGHVVGREHEPGTGAVLHERGPSSSSCGSGCTNVEQTWTDVDGLGRPLATWVNREVPGNPVWQKTQVGQMSYRDSTSLSGARTSVVTRSLVDYDGGLWSREETEVDGQGRPDVVTVTTGFNHDAVTTYDYDHRGLLVAVTVPDPSQDSTATVTYTYGYDSLGRPTSMRRPPVGGATATGVDLTYDGLVHERTEVAGTAGGPEARTRLVHDVFGRLLEVHEYTDAANVAVTRYAYDAGDRVRRIENADGVVTELVHDFGGRRTQIERHGRTWRYVYNASGDMTSEVAPAPGGGPDLAYTTTFAYDALGRQSSRSVGTRGLPAPDLALLGIGMITFTHDTCTNGVGRLCQVSFPNGVLTTSLSYDAEGNVTEERRQFDFAGATGERVARTTYGPGGKVVAQTYGDHSVIQTAGINLPLDDGTRATFEYDQRHLPLLVRWVKKPEPATVAVQVRNVAGLVTRRETHLLTQGWAELSSDWVYDPLTRVVSQTVTAEHGPPLPQTVVLAKQQLDYFGQDDPSRLRHWLGSAYYDFAYEFDRRHQLAGVAEDGGRMDAAYTFTTAGKLASADVLGTPAPGGELVARKVTYEYASPADPEAVSALRDNKGGALRSYDYDTVGSMVERTGWDTTELFVYDGEDQLRRATRTGPGAGVEEYFYDHAGHRAAVVTRDAGGAVESVRVFFGDAEVVLSPTGWVTKAHAHLSLGTPVARITDRSELELQYHGLANSTLVSAAPTGDIQSGFVYGPYGEVLESVGPAVEDQHRRFNDKFQDDLTRLSYYGVRYYDNLLLGWTQADPMYRFVPDWDSELPRTALLYQFTLNNPLRYSDPDGRHPLLIPPAVLGGEAAAAGAAAAVAAGVGAVVIIGAALVDLFSPGERDERDSSPGKPSSAEKAEQRRIGKALQSDGPPGCSLCGAPIPAGQAGTSATAAALVSMNQAQDAGNKKDANSPPPAPPSGGSKKEPDVVTANGQKAAADGTPIGGSGKKVFHNSDSPTRKKQVDGARQQAGKTGSTVKDKATVKQTQHYHAVKRTGKRVSGARKTHFTRRGDTKKKPPSQP